MSVDIKELYRNTEKYIDKEITVEGWIRTLRSSKNFGFIEINDGSFFSNVQVVFGSELDNFSEIGKLPISTALRVKGILVSTPEAKQKFEIKATEVVVEGMSTTDYPL